MKIRKHGNQYVRVKPDPTESFKCDNCGCEFSVKEDEYYIDYGGADYKIGDWVTATYTISTIIKDNLVCSCPECHKICKKIRERKNDNITLNPVTYTYGTAVPSNKIEKDYVTITCSEEDL